MSSENQTINMNELTQEQCLNVIIQGVLRGQARGIYSLTEAEILAKAIRTFVVEVPAKKEE